jgi:hypothetical protein
MLKDVPSLPSDMSKGGILEYLEEQPVWHLPEPQLEEEDDLEGSGGIGEKDFPINQLYGMRKYLHFSFPTPITCGIRHREDSDVDGGSETRAMNPPGLLMLTLCCSYILSVRLWELQGRTVTYTRQC